MDIGAQFRAAREASGLSIGAVAERTRVPARALSAIEQNDQSALPPHPFGRGFVRTYAEELHLDPERIVRDYFAQFPAPPSSGLPGVAREAPDTSWQPPSRWSGMGTAVVILVVVVATAVVLGRRGDGTAAPSMIGTTGTAAPTPAPMSETPSDARPDSASAVAPPTTLPSPPPVAPVSGAITIVLSMSRPCWIDATVDGRREIYRVLPAGGRETLVAERTVSIRFGDAGAVLWTINGRDAGTPGAPGAIRDVQITLANAATVR